MIDLGDGRHWVAPVYLIEDCIGEPVVLKPPAEADEPALMV